MPKIISFEFIILKKKTLSIFVENTKEIHVSVLKSGIENEVDKMLRYCSD